MKIRENNSICLGFIVKYSAEDNVNKIQLNANSILFF